MVVNREIQMLIAFCAGCACLMAGAAAWKYGLDIPSAAGAGAPGSIMMLVGGVLWVVSIFLFGMSAGGWLLHS